MKKILLITVLLTSFGVYQSNAQFFDKLKKRVLEKTEELVIDKTADKAAEKTGEAMDNLLNPDFGKFMSPMGKQVDIAELPASYKFDYRYAMKLTTQEAEMDMDYYLSKTEPYMAIKMNMGGDMSVVFDEGNKAVYTSMGGMTMATEMDLSDVVDQEDEDIYTDYTFKELPNRTFLGYDCIGREMENAEYKFTIYIAPNIESGFGNMFKSEHANLPPTMQKFTEEYQNGLMMYMDMVDKKDKKSNATMECVAFEPTNYVINTR